jgi:hydrogenase/urease accessory protein HupE
VLAALLATSAAAAPCAAHTTSTGVARVRAEGADVAYELTVVPDELPDAARALLAGAAAGDAGAAERAAAEARRRVTVAAGGAPCHAGRITFQASGVGDGRVTTRVTFRCERAAPSLRVRDDWFDLFGAHYRTLARVETGGEARDVAFMPDAREVTIGTSRGASDGGSFFRLGVEHILTGVDHMLFLAALLLGGGGAAGLLKTITAFTLAHSVTLALAVLGAVTLPPRVVEPVIAASIAWVALENLVLQRAPSRRWLVSFAFGLVHGFGFADALTPLALPPGGLARALVGFNLGVEAGQALAIALVLPLLVWARRRGWEPMLVRGGSVALTAVGLAWLVERLFLA